MIDSFLLIAAGLSAAILMFFAVGAIASFFPALAIYCGTLWFSFFRWAARMLIVVVLFAVFVCFALQLS